MSTLDLLLAASNEQHDEATLRVRMANQAISLRNRITKPLDLQLRLQRLMEHPAQLKWMDAEDLVDVLREAIDEDDDVLQSELLALTVTVARLGSVLLAMRLGRRVIEEMQCPPAEKSPSPYSQN